MKECPLIAILRGITPEETEQVCDVLYKNGIRLLEIPLNSPNALKSIEIAVKHTEGRMLVGAGTVLTPEDVRGVHAAGGKFIISPNTDAAVIRESKALGMLSIPGFFPVAVGNIRTALVGVDARIVDKEVDASDFFEHCLDRFLAGNIARKRNASDVRCDLFRRFASVCVVDEDAAAEFCEFVTERFAESA